MIKIPYFHDAPCHEGLIFVCHNLGRMFALMAYWKEQIQHDTLLYSSNVKHVTIDVISESLSSIINTVLSAQMKRYSCCFSFYYALSHKVHQFLAPPQLL